MLIIHNYNLVIKKKTNDKPSIIKKDNLTLDNITGEILYIKAQNLDYPVICPLCNQEMKIRDSKRRYIKLESGNRIPINLKRYYCSECKKIHTEIPDLITPYKQYDKFTIEKVANAQNPLVTFQNSDIFESSAIKYFEIAADSIEIPGNYSGIM